MLVFAVVVVVGLGLVGGAVWGAFGPVPSWAEGLLLSTAAGALITSIAFELVEPAVERAGITTAMVGLTAGAVVFTVVDYVIDEIWSSQSGLGIMAAVTLDGVPENLALGVALTGATVGDVAALSAAILLSNLPEAAGGAHDLREAGWGRWKNVEMWIGVAVLLALATVLGRVVFRDMSDTALAVVSVFAAGAVLASLTTEVIPEAFQQARQWAGIAITAGFVVTFVLAG